MNAGQLEFFYCLDMFPSLRGHFKREQLFAMYDDYCRSVKNDLSEPIDYLKYGFHELSDEERAKYITRRKYAALCDKYNSVEDAKYLRDKALFIERYEQFLCRDAMEALPDARLQYDMLCSRHHQLMLKPTEGGYGRGLRVFDTHIEREFGWAQALSTRAILEEVIVQHEGMARFHPGSVNCVRMVSVIAPSGEVTLMASTFHCGRGSAIKDNGEGIFASIDMKTGRICTQGTTHFREDYGFHPDSGLRFKDYRIPHWKELLCCARDAALVLPGLRLVAWDWALRSDGKWALIEGNVGGGIGPCQEAPHRGMASEVLAVLEGREAKA